MRAELWEAKAAVFAPYSGTGLTIADVARKTHTTYHTAKRYAEKFGFDFAFQTGNKKAASEAAREFQDNIVASLMGMAEEGSTRREAAKALGVSYNTVVRYGIRHNIPFIHEKADQKAEDRATAMAAMYKGGKTLNEIGKLHGLTRERVRQLIKKHCGLTGADGGQSTLAQRKREAAQAKRDIRSLARHGCSHEQYLALVSLGKKSMSRGGTRERSPTGAFTRQRQAARQRGIEWNLKLWDWWQIWQLSGKWDDRGRGKGKYVMCRFGDAGSYEVGNVYIATHEHNVSFQPNNPYRKDHPDHAEAVGAIRHKLSGGARHKATRPGRDLPVGVYSDRGRYRAQVSIFGKLHYIGTFDTAESARDAIDARLAASSLRAAA